MATYIVDISRDGGVSRRKVTVRADSENGARTAAMHRIVSGLKTKGTHRFQVHNITRTGALMVSV